MADQTVLWSEINNPGVPIPIVRAGVTGGNDQLTVDMSLAPFAVNFFIAVDNTNVAQDASGQYNVREFPVGNPVQAQNIQFSNFERFNIISAGGNDSFATGNGFDQVSTGGGDDFVNTRAGGAVVNLGAGIDRWHADLSAMTTGVTIDISNPGGAQTITGLAGSSISGIENLGQTENSLNDFFRFGSGNDVVVTNNNATAGSGDFLAMGAGDDIATIRGGVDRVNGGAGIDTLIIDWSASPGGITFGGPDPVTGNGSGNATLGGPWYAVNYFEMEKFQITGTAVGDFIVTGNFDDVISGGGGDDGIDTRRGAAVVDGGAGTDRWFADFTDLSSNITINLNTSTITGAGASTITGIEQLGNDGNRFRTGSGNDTIDTLALLLEDAVNTGGGNDTVIFRGGPDQVNMGEGVGDDDLLVLFYTTAINVGGGPGSFNGDDASGGFTVGGLGVANFVGVERMWLFGADNAAAGDSVSGVLGNDIIVLAAGNDTGNGGGGADAILGGAGNDTLNGDAGNDLLMGGSDYDPLGTGSGDDTLNGGDGIDTIFGQDGVDTINGGLDADYVLAGAGNDVVNGGDGDDFLLAGGAWALNAANAGNDTINGGNGVDFIAGGTGDDTLNGDAGDDIVYGGDGIDTINGGVGSDSLFGGGGNDIINTSGGTDFAYGEAGADRLNVNAGTAGTTFYYADALDTVRFQGFGAPVDTFAELQTFMTPDFYGPGSVLITLPGSVTVVVFGLTLTAGNTSFG